MNKRALSVATVVLFSTFFAQQVLAKREHGQHPPQEAITACENQVEGDSVSFTSPHDDVIEATCKLKDEQLIAVPKNGKRPENKGNKSDIN